MQTVSIKKFTPMYHPEWETAPCPVCGAPKGIEDQVSEIYINNKVNCVKCCEMVLITA